MDLQERITELEKELTDREDEIMLLKTNLFSLSKEYEHLEKALAHIEPNTENFFKTKFGVVIFGIIFSLLLIAGSFALGRWGIIGQENPKVYEKGVDYETFAAMKKRAERAEKEIAILNTQIESEQSPNTIADSTRILHLARKAGWVDPETYAAMEKQAEQAKQNQTTQHFFEPITGWELEQLIYKVDPQAAVKPQKNMEIPEIGTILFIGGSQQNTTAWITPTPKD